ncbi:MAG: hypothetical protein A2X46_18650 [Lentisphaerae bacterium GWF2_57_35]|nr:MAG: hypothetical protein A2X46_18650 [Lentisphaerae bacterium GWF2_57_35]
MKMQSRFPVVLFSCFLMTAGVVFAGETVAIRKYPIPTANSQPFCIEVAQNGTVWFTELAGKKVGSLNPETGAIAEYPVTYTARGIAVSRSENAVYFAGDVYGNGQIGRLTPGGAGAVHLLSTGLPLASAGMCSLDQEGRLWFGGWDSGYIGCVSPNGLNTFKVPPACSGYMTGLARDELGRFWCTSVGWDESNPRLVRFDPATTSFLSIAFPADRATIRSTLAVGGKIWMSVQDTSKIASYDPCSGQFTQYATPTPNAAPNALAADRWGRIWFVEHIAGRIGVLDPATGVIREFVVGTAEARLAGIAVDMNTDEVWATDMAAHQIVRLTFRTDPGLGPVFMDSDRDGLTDTWEMQYFGTLAHGAAGDADADGLSNLQEFLAQLNPVLSDQDQDGLRDGWEVQYGLDPRDPADAGLDTDSDGYDNRTEFLQGTRPNDALSDPGPKYRVVEAGRFDDVTSKTWDCAAVDVDGDSDLDLAVVVNFSSNILYRNDGGQFTPMESGDFDQSGGYVQATCVVSLDADGDGDVDLAVGNYTEPNELYINQGQGVFTNASCGDFGNPGAGFYHTLKLATLDADGDGDADLVEVSYSQCTKLYLNDGRGVFTRTEAGELDDVAGPHFALAVLDADNDGDTDVVVGDHGGRTALYINDGAAHFCKVDAGELDDAAMKTDNLTAFDANGDGRIDLAAGNYGEPNYLYLNLGSHQFRKIEAGAFDDAAAMTRNMVAFDADRDGDLDLAVAQETKNNVLYLNNGQGVFRKGNAGAFGAQAGLTKTLAVFDADGDGWEDVVAGNCGQVCVLYRRISPALTRYVSASGRHLFPYLTWADAATNIQAAVAVSSHGETVLATNGVYRLGATVRLTNGIALKSVNGQSATTLDGQYGARCLYLAHSNAVVSGFTIVRGSANRGAGAFCDKYGTLVSCLFTNNSAWYSGWRDGGAVFLNQGGLIANSTVRGNYSGAQAGGILCLSGGQVESCIVEGNQACYDGGGVYCWMGGTVNNCRIQGNRAGGHAGGLYGWGARGFGNLVCSNYAGGEGGGLHWVSGVLENTVVKENRGAYSGGGATLWWSTLRNSLVVSNEAVNHGGGIECVASRVESCTVSGNKAPNGGGIAFEQNGIAVNSILYGNTAANGPNYGGAGAGSISYSCIYPIGAYAAAGCLESEPLFAGNGSYALSPRSPCIDAGLLETWMSTATDLNGQPRLDHGAVDMGAYEAVWCDANHPQVSEQDADMDTDRDGMSDAEEAVAGTNQADSDSLLNVHAVRQGDVMLVCWPSVEGRVYDLYRTDSLLAPFSEIATAIPATPPMNCYTDTVDNAMMLFYKIVAEKL